MGRLNVARLFARFVAHVIAKDREKGWLAGPIFVLGLLASFFATSLEPVAWMAMLAGVSMRTYSRRSRLLVIPAAFWVGSAVRIMTVPSSIEDDVLTFVVGSAVWGAIFAVPIIILLVPLILASCRAAASREHSVVRSSHSRSPWCVALAVACPLGGWVAFVRGFRLFGGGGSEDEISRWKAMAQWPAWAALVGTVAFLYVDLVAYRRAGGFRRREQLVAGAHGTEDAVIDLGIGDERWACPQVETTERYSYRDGGSVMVLGSIAAARRAFRVSIAIDTAAVLCTAAYLVRIYALPKYAP